MPEKSVLPKYRLFPKPAERWSKMAFLAFVLGFVTVFFSTLGYLIQTV